MRPNKYKSKTNKKKHRIELKKKNKQKKNNTKKTTKRKIIPNKRENLNNANNYLYNNIRPTDDVCYGVVEPKSVKHKKTRVFAIIGHSSFCTYDELTKIKQNREPDGFRLNINEIVPGYKNIRFISAQDIGKKSSVTRMEEFIKQLQDNEKIYSGLLQLDDIKSTKNFSKLVDCDLRKQAPETYDFIKEHYMDSSTTLNFNVYPKKDLDSTQNPINSSYNFVQMGDNEPFMGIYELTTVVSHSTPYLGPPIADTNEIDADFILFNPEINEAFLTQRKRNSTVYKNRLAIYNTPKNKSKSNGDPHKISSWDLLNSKLAVLKGCLMIPDRTTESNLLTISNGPDEYEIDEYTRFNKKLFDRIGRRNTFEVSLNEIISIILNDEDIKTTDEIIIMDFGCNHISDLRYNNNIWDRPIIDRVSTVKIPESIRKEIGPIVEPGDYKYYTNRWFEESR